MVSRQNHQYIFPTLEFYDIIRGFFYAASWNFIIIVFLFKNFMEKYIKQIAEAININSKQVAKTLELLKEGATVPFISRYRKEVTGALDEVEITSIRDLQEKLLELDKRREAIIKAIDEQEKLTAELEKQINQATSLTELEDIYLPYKQKRKTKAVVAREKGLEPLAKKLISQQLIDINTTAEKFINKEKKVNTVEEALAGARDIIAEWVNENQRIRKRIRNLFFRQAMIKTKLSKGKEEEGQKYRDYFAWEEKAMQAPSHRVLAMLRAERGKFISINISPTKEDAIKTLEQEYINADNDAAEQVSIAIEDAYKRLLQPSMENEIRANLKEKADEKAIGIFVENLRQLLMSAPLGQKNILALDPGFRSGCKVVCLDKQGKLLHNETIYPHAPQRKTKEAINKIKSLVSAYQIEAIAVGNGTAGRETEDMIRRIRFDKDILAIMVNESGASIYSASKLAREEFPEYDVTVRGTVSIGRRLMDPLAELVKIDPKSIGVGQYQHDVNQKELQKSLDDTVVSCVNAVGVDVNTASKELLQYVSGFNASIAANIINYRDENGAFKKRKELTKVPRLGAKAFEQAAGFMRIQNATNPLENSAVHPESYYIVEKMAKSLDVKSDDLMNDADLRKQINILNYVTAEVGLPTLEDIMLELEKPGRDPREKFGFFEFDKNVQKIKDLTIGMELPGIITNITAFGAFVDVGVHQDGLVHISQLADEYVSDPNEFVKLNQKVKVKVLEVDAERKRISLSMKGL
jgi:protein Tex